jgi:hypothetical protein
LVVTKETTTFWKRDSVRDNRAHPLIGQRIFGHNFLGTYTLGGRGVVTLEKVEGLIT